MLAFPGMIHLSLLLILLPGATRRGGQVVEMLMLLVRHLICNARTYVHMSISRMLSTFLAAGQCPMLAHVKPVMQQATYSQAPSMIKSIIAAM